MDHLQMEKDEKPSDSTTQLSETHHKTAGEAASTGSLWNKIAIVGFGFILISTLLVLYFASSPADLQPDTTASDK